ncbi:MAG: MFS transporter [Alphaproteobacteria bacterium]|nr:MFS transporter [Alphaproteobacteria bacterium]
MAERSINHALYVLLFGNFVIGTGVLLPAGLLNQLSAELAVPVPTAGLLLLAGGVVVGVGAPLLAMLTTAMDRRLLLVLSMLLYAVGHFVSAFATSFWLLLTVRVLMISAAGIFSPQAAATVGLLVEMQRRASAIAFIFIGWSIASVAGIPLGALLGEAIGWRMVFGVMGAFSLLSAAAIWFTVPRKLFGARLSLASWQQVFTSPALLMVLLVTLLSMSGQFVVFGYLAPILKQVCQATPAQISLAFAIAGLAGVIGNALGSRMVRSVPVTQVIAFGLVALCVGFVLFTVLFGIYWGMIAGMALWGLGTFSSNSLQQSRLVQLAPPLASATVALNTSGVYLGQAVGAGVGGILIKDGATFVSGSTALVFLGLALAASLYATRLKV